MPRYPHFAPAVSALGTSLYSTLGDRARASGHPVCPLHIGDTWMAPAEGCRMADLTEVEYPGLHRYAPVQGRPDLIAALEAEVGRLQGLPVEPGGLLVTAGGTGGLGAVAGAIVEPGAEVLIPAPFWPLIAGIVRAFNGVAVEVPFFTEAFMGDEGPARAIEALEAQRTDRTVALYLNSPHNPTGAVLPEAWIKALTAWAVERGLWILADEVYEHCHFDDAPHTYLRPLAPEHTFSIHSFSKAFGMAGNRCGYVVGPAEAITMLRKVSTHTFYSTPTAAQVAAVRALAGPGLEWAQKATARYRELGWAAADRLGLPRPMGSTFLFIDVAEQLDEGPDALARLMTELADEGLLLAPGPYFGPYPTSVRLCFTSAEPALVERGVEVLARRLGR